MNEKVKTKQYVQHQDLPFRYIIPKPQDLILTLLSIEKLELVLN
jgi:hypothetical protein